MQWAYYWYYSALGCHGHLVRDIQFSLFHHHYLWGHLLWKMNSASFAWLISNFFFIYLTEGHMPGIWSSWKKKWKKKRAWERKSGAVCIRGWMWRWSRSLRPTSLSYCMCHSCPDDIFFPLSYCTQNRATERESFSPQPSWRPPGFSPIVGGCISIFFFWFPGLWVMKSMLAEDKSSLPCLSVLCVVLLGLPLVGERVFSFCVFWASTVTKIELAVTCERCGHGVRYVMLIRLILWTQGSGSVLL